MAPTGQRAAFTYVTGPKTEIMTPSGAITTNVWNYENQSTLTELPSGIRVTSMYNAENRRVRKES